MSRKYGTPISLIVFLASTQMVVAKKGNPKRLIGNSSEREQLWLMKAKREAPVDIGKEEGMGRRARTGMGGQMRMTLSDAHGRTLAEAFGA